MIAPSFDIPYTDMQPKATLLVVEDDIHLLGGIKDILELDSYNVLTAQNGREALDIMNFEKPDLIVSDIMMPHMDGIELLKNVREQTSTIPFIFLTARGERSDIYRGRKLGVDDYLVKPFEAEDLLVAVESRLQRVRAFQTATRDEIDGVKRNIVTILGHELRTPLTLVVGYAELLKDINLEAMSHTELLTFLRGINDGADRLRRLIENFILLVEIDAGDVEKTYEWRAGDVADLSTIVLAARDYVFSKGENHKCRADIPANLPPVYGDREYLMIVFRELLDNAAKFSPEGSEVSITVSPDGKSIRTEIRDQGDGIPPEELKRIWDIFHQVDRDKHEHQGGGAGLPIVQGLVKLHGGVVEVESTEGEGSMFAVSLPVKQAGSA